MTRAQAAASSRSSRRRCASTPAARRSTAASTWATCAPYVFAGPPEPHAALLRLRRAPRHQHHRRGPPARATPTPATTRWRRPRASRSSSAWDIAEQVDARVPRRPREAPLPRARRLVQGDRPHPRADRDDPRAREPRASPTAPATASTSTPRRTRTTASSARIDLAAQEAQARIEARAREAQRRPTSRSGSSRPQDGPRRQMEWDSPWGRGFPGWHIECSAMSAKYLGTTLRHPHRRRRPHPRAPPERDRAVRERPRACGPGCAIWMHSGWLMFDGAKISKSTGGSVLNLDELIEKGFEPLAFRYFLLGAHYRQQLDLLGRGACAARSSRCAGCCATPRSCATTRRAAAWPELASELRARFRAALADDLNAPQALAVVWEAVRSEALGGAREVRAAARVGRRCSALGLGGACARLTRRRTSRGRTRSSTRSSPSATRRAPRRTGSAPTRCATSSKAKGIAIVDSPRRDDAGAVPDFEVVSDYKPLGDQPRAIEELVVRRAAAACSTRRCSASPAAARPRPCRG